MAIHAHATAKYVRTSAQKAGLVLDLIRGRDVNAALATLRFARKSVARDIEKVLRSAIANAQQKDGFGGDVERLFVDACYANQGPSQKRIRPAPMGRAFRVVKRTAHLTVAVTRAAVEGGRGAGGGSGRCGDAEAAARREAEGQASGEEEARVASRRRAKSGARTARTARRRRRRPNDGTKSSSARIPARLQQDVALAVVRRSRLREAAARGSEAARQAEGALRARRRLEDRDRARREQAEDRHLHVAARASSSAARAPRSTS